MTPENTEAAQLRRAWSLIGKYRGRIGGRSRSPKKILASQINGAKGGRPKGKVI